jgi:hypothetical protein
VLIAAALSSTTSYAMAEADSNGRRRYCKKLRIFASS